jgi:hypothetical protein
MAPINTFYRTPQRWLFRAQYAAAEKVYLSGSAIACLAAAGGNTPRRHWLFAGCNRGPLGSRAAAAQRSGSRWQQRESDGGKRATLQVSSR